MQDRYETQSHMQDRYHNDPNYLDGQIWVNSVDQDEASEGESDQC